MRYYEKPVNRADKDGARLEEHGSKDKDIRAAEKAGDYCYPTDAYAEQPGYLGMDDIDRIRRERLKHQTR
jgi:hypothetical protein